LSTPSASLPDQRPTTQRDLTDRSTRDHAVTATSASHETLQTFSDLPLAESLSIVIPVFNEEGNLQELYKRLTAALGEIGLPYEIVFVDDGSVDGTWRSIAAMHGKDNRVRAIKHRRNFGKAQALANGFSVATGDVVVTMDGDLQDDPAELPKMLARINDGYDLVSGWKQNRQDPAGKTMPSKLFNWTVSKVSGVPLHDFNCGFKAYRHEVTETIRLYGELHRFTPVLASAEGFRVTEIPVVHHPRTWGKSKYGIKRLIKGFLDLITVFFLTNYRQRPMHLFGIPGILSLALGTLIGLYLTYERLALDEQIGTRPLLMLAVLLIVVGTQFFGLGLLGEFLAHGSNSPRPNPGSYLRESLGVAHLDLARDGALPQGHLEVDGPSKPADRSV
jgi:glycosyltransferase involved in cell wall biosynthesis